MSMLEKGEVFRQRGGTMVVVWWWEIFFPDGVGGE